MVSIEPRENIFLYLAFYTVWAVNDGESGLRVYPEGAFSTPGIWGFIFLLHTSDLKA